MSGVGAHPAVQVGRISSPNVLGGRKTGVNQTAWTKSEKNIIKQKQNPRQRGLQGKGPPACTPLHKDCPLDLEPPETSSDPLRFSQGCDLRRLSSWYRNLRMISGEARRKTHARPVGATFGDEKQIVFASASFYEGRRAHPSYFSQKAIEGRRCERPASQGP